MNSTDTHINEPWYKNPWVWFIIAIPSCSVVLGSIMLTLAINTEDTLVKDEYYKEGKAINEVLVRNKRADQLGIAAQISIDEVTGGLQLQLQGQLKPSPDKLKLSIMSPTQAKKDQIITVHQIAPMHYSGELNMSVNGRRYVHLETIELATKHKPSEEGWLIQSEIIIADKPFTLGQFE